MSTSPSKPPVAATPVLAQTSSMGSLDQDTTSHVDDQNLLLVNSASEVDRINSGFYGRFPYPWQPEKLDRSLDPGFEAAMLCQAVGDWQHERVSSHAAIWVAGCGTNQAVITALHFPEAHVIGSDLSQPSLDLCARTASNLDVRNLEVRRESLNDAQYEEKFDYILCTGVVHHNAGPGATLRRLAIALKPNGILELMVYNRYHRIITSAFQKAIRILCGSEKEPGSVLELRLTRAITNGLPKTGLMAHLLRGFQDAPREAVADALLQPVEHSYTVGTLSALATDCGLQMLLPCVSAIDKAQDTFSWNLFFENPELRQRYYALDDISRWHVSNLLLVERSPMLWVYFQRADSNRPRKSEMEICNTFLETRFTKSRTKRQGYLRIQNGSYQPTPSTTDYPGLHQQANLQKVIESADSKTAMRVLLERCGLPSTFPQVNDIRLRLTTPVFPYLQSCP